MSSWAPRSSNTACWRDIASLKSSIMHKEVTFKISQWKLDFPLALGGWSRKPFDPPSGAAQLGALNWTFIDVVELSSHSSILLYSNKIQSITKKIQSIVKMLKKYSKASFIHTSSKHCAKVCYLPQFGLPSFDHFHLQVWNQCCIRNHQKCSCFFLDGCLYPGCRLFLSIRSSQGFAVWNSL